MIMINFFQVQTHPEDNIAFPRLANEINDNDGYPHNHHHLMMILITKADHDKYLSSQSHPEHNGVFSRLADESNDNDDDDKNDIR